MFNTTDIPKSSRIPKLIEALYAKMQVIESAISKLITESYKTRGSFCSHSPEYSDYHS